MSGNNIFSEFALAVRRTMSPIRKQDNTSSTDKSKSPSRGTIHKLKQILPHHVLTNTTEYQSLNTRENQNIGLLESQENAKHSEQLRNHSTKISKVMEEHVNRRSKLGHDNSFSTLGDSDALLDQSHQEQVLTCTIREAIVKERPGKVSKLPFYTFKI